VLAYVPWSLTLQSGAFSKWSSLAVYFQFFDVFPGGQVVLYLWYMMCALLVVYDVLILCLRRVNWSVFA